MKRYTYSRKGVDWEALLKYMGDAVACKAIDPFPEKQHDFELETYSETLKAWRKKTETSVERVAQRLKISGISIRNFEANNPVTCGNVYLKLEAFVKTLGDSRKHAVESMYLKLWREDNLYTQEDVANFLGVHVNTIKRFEKDASDSKKILDFINNGFKLPSPIKLLRKDLSLKELEELIGVTRSHLSAIERGTKKLTGKTKEKYIAFFGEEAVTDAIERTEAESRVER